MNPTTRRPAPPASPLAGLNAHIERASQAARPDGAPPDGRWPALRSAQRFRETWALLCAEDAVEQASERAPENAGPLNSHRLVLHTLGLMRELSPDYLRRFLVQADALLWLDQAQERLKAAGTKGKRTRRQGG